MSEAINYREVELLTDHNSPDPLEQVQWSICADVDSEESEEIDCIAFDHIGLSDGRYILISAIDCNSACFCDMFQAYVVYKDELLAVAQNMIGNAIDWFIDNGYHYVDLEDTTQDWLITLKAYACLEDSSESNSDSSRQEG